MKRRARPRVGCRYFLNGVEALNLAAHHRHLRPGASPQDARASLPTSRLLWFAAATLIAVASLWITPDAQAQNQLTILQGGGEEPPPYLGSFIFLTQSVSTLTFNPNEELTYNPNYSLTASFLPRWAFGKDRVWFMSGSFNLSREITNADWTTQDGETIASDLRVSFGGWQFYTIPVLDIALSTRFDIIAPTSPSSQAASMIMGLGGSLSAMYIVDILGGLAFTYAFGVNHPFFEYTTAGFDDPVITNCAADQCDRFSNTGFRNSDWNLNHSANIWLGFSDWASMTVAAGWTTSYLLPAAESADVSYVSQEPVDARYSIWYDLSLTFRPWGPLMINLGLNTSNPQLSPTEGYYDPVFNRFSTLYLDIGVDAGRVIASTINAFKE